MDKKQKAKDLEHMIKIVEDIALNEIAMLPENSTDSLLDILKRAVKKTEKMLTGK